MDESSVERRLYFVLPENLLIKLKVEAAKQLQTQKSFVIEAVEFYLEFIERERIREKKLKQKT